MCRYVREFSLPKKLPNLILKSLANVPAVTDLKYSDLPPEVSVNDFLRKTADTRALALILFALKSLYSLDDQTEYALSAAAEKVNRENGEGKRR